MNTSNFNKTLLLVVIMIATTFRPFGLYAQHLFSLTHNELSSENAVQLKGQIANSASQKLSLSKNAVKKDVYPVSLSGARKSKIIILNEQTGKNVVITPADESQTQFQLTPFLIEELRQSVLGDASQYLVVEAETDFSVKKVDAVPVSSTSDKNVFLPRYFYGTKENVKEALPKDRKIIHIFKEKPRLIPAFPDDPENLRQLAQLEEEMSYYVYMYQLPDGTLCIYDEHFISDQEKKEPFAVTNTEYATGENVQFILTGNQNTEQQTATRHALNLWSEQLAGTVPVNIDVTFKELDNASTIGQSWNMPTFWHPETQTWYFSSLGNQIAGYDFAPGMVDIRLEMNSKFPFYYGINGNPSASQMDWITIMMHEVLHGLGFAGLCRETGRYTYVANNGNNIYQSLPGYPSAYDRQLFQGTAGPCLTELNQSQRADLVISDNLYAGAPGSRLLAANDGKRVKMYAPNPYKGGSSISHWDSSVDFPTFMKYATSRGSKLHAINEREIAILMDMGWTQPEEDSDTFAVSPDSYDFAASGGVSSEINITCNTTWTVKTDAAWLTVSKSGGSNNSTFTMTASANTSASLRTATVTVTSDGKTKTVRVTQSASTPSAPENDLCSNAILLSCGTSVQGTLTGATRTTAISYLNNVDKNDVFYYFTAAEAGNYTITLSNFSDDKDLFLYSNCSATVALNSSAGIGSTETITHTCSAGITYRIRITDYSGTGGTFDIKIDCPSTTTASLTVTPTFYNFASGGGVSSEVTVTSNTTWTVTSDASWLTTSLSGGSNNSTFTMTASENTSDYWRLAFVTVSGGGITKYVIVTQDIDINPDPYEPNNTLDQAYSLPVTFTGNIATVKTTGSNIHNDTDEDYYKIELPAGYKYTINARLHDSYNSNDGNRYTVDAVLYYRITEWSDEYDDIIPHSIIMENGGTIYFYVGPYFDGEMGTYLLDINMVREQYITLPVPENDLCSNAILLPCGTSLQGNLTGATRTTTISYSDYVSKNDVFYYFTAAGAGNYTITLSNFSDDKDLFLYADCSATAALDSSEDIGTTEMITYPCTEGTTYCIRVTDYSGTGGTFDIKLDCLTAALLTVTPTTYNFAAGGGVSSEVTVTSNTTWTVTSDASWLTTSLSSGSNNGTFTMMATANTTDSQRSATISVSGDGITQTVTVTQDSGLTPDPYEPNNTLAQAYSLPVTFTGNTATIKTTGSNIHNDTDEDYYKIELPAGYKYTINARLHDSYHSDDGNRYTVDAILYYRITEWSDGYDDIIPDPIMMANGGTIYFYARSFFDGEMGTYLLEINMVREQLITMPAPENDLCSNAILLSCGTPVQGTLTGATRTAAISYSDYANTNDVFYYFTTADAGNYAITLSNFSDDKDLLLYSDCSATDALNSSESTDPTETITHTCTAGTTYRIRITDYSGTGGTFDIQIDCQSTVLNPDPYEPNNTPDQAYSLPVTFTGNTATVKTTGSNIHNDTDEDYYKIELPAGYKYTINARLHDSYNSDDGNRYTVDAVLLYWITEWSDEYDDIIPYPIIMENGGTIYFYVGPYSYGELGTYLLDINLVREQSLSSDASLAGILVNNQPAAPKQGSAITWEIAIDYTNSINIVATAGHHAATIQTSQQGVKSVYVGTNTFEIAVTAENGNTVNYVLVVFVGDITSSADEHTGMPLTAYPNPVRDRVTIGGLQGCGALNVLDASGRLWIQHNITSLEETIERRSLPAGMYFVQIVEDKTVRTVKIIVE